MIAYSYVIPSGNGEFTVLVPLVATQNTLRYFAPLTSDDGASFSSKIITSAGIVTTTNSVDWAEGDRGIGKLVLTEAERLTIDFYGSVMLCIMDVSGALAAKMLTVYVTLISSKIESEQLTQIANDTSIVRKSRTNRNSVTKIGTTTYDEVYDDDDETKIIERALTTPSGGDLPSMTSGTYPANAAKSTI